MNPGRFIVFEGIDGAGTTSQMTRLLQAFQRRDASVHATAEPSTGPIGRLLRSLLAGAAAPVDPEAVALLFAADRRDHLAREVLPNLRAGVHVLCDRYVLSSLVYQTAAGAPRALVERANAGIHRPDLTLFIDVPTSVASERRRRRSAAADLYEDEPTQEAVAQAYRDEARLLQEAGAPIMVLDGSGAMEEVEALVHRALAQRLGLMG